MCNSSMCRRAVNSLFRGAGGFERVENTRLAWYARNFLVNPRPPAPESVPTQLQKDLELVRVRLLECRDPRERDVWLHGAIRVAQAINPYLAPDDALPVWSGIVTAPCFRALTDYQRDWVGLFRAVAGRDTETQARLAARLLAAHPEVNDEAREYLLSAAMSAQIARGERAAALELWTRHGGAQLRRPGAPAFRLLRCHAEPASCAEAFRAYAER